VTSNEGGARRGDIGERVGAGRQPAPVVQHGAHGVRTCGEAPGVRRPPRRPVRTHVVDTVLTVDVNWVSWVLGVASSLVVAGVVGGVRWLNRPRGHMQPLVENGPGVVRVRAVWVGAGEAWDVIMLPEGGPAQRERVSAPRLSDGNGDVALLLGPGDASVVTVRWRTRSRGHHARGLLVDLASGRATDLSHADIIKRGA
jgi:hypothetical protein